MEAADAGHQIPDHDMIKTPEQIEGIRESCKINVAVLDYVAEHIKAGVTTEEIDQWVYNETTRMGGIPAPLGYEGFPKSVCTSINDQVCHGIPSADVVLRMAISSTWMFRPFITAIMRILPVCSASEMSARNIKTGGRCQRVRGIRSGAGKTVGLHG